MDRKLSGKKLKVRGIKNSNLKKKMGQKCIYCGCNNKLILTIDHIKPLARGGEDSDKNKQVACVFCNWLKGPLTNVEFRRYYSTLMTLKDLHKITLYPGDFKITFNCSGYPMKVKEVKSDEEFKGEVSEWQDQ